ncbi:MAG: NosD domain-containing protein [Promethearchaeota archaeon]
MQKITIKHVMILGVLLVSAVNIASINDDSNAPLERKNYEVSRDTRVKTANYWNDFTFIHINNGNWSDGVTGGWIYGDGSKGNPFRLENMTIDATDSPTGSGIYIANEHQYYFEIRNCTVLNAPRGDFYDGGIKLEAAGNGTIIDCNCSNNNYGIWLINSNHTNVIGCNFTGNLRAIGTEYGYNISLEQNTIFNCEEDGFEIFETTNVSVHDNNLYDCSANGMSLIFALNTTLRNNHLFNCGVQLAYGDPLSWSGKFEYLDVDQSNTVNTKPILYYCSQNYLQIDQPELAGQIILAKCNHSVIKNQELLNTSYGIYLYYCRNDTISENTFTNCSISGIELFRCFDITIEHNEINEYVYPFESNNTIIFNNNFTEGISMSQCKYSNISYNRFLNPPNLAIGINFGSFDNISNNQFSEPNKGVSVMDSSYETIYNNSILLSESYGIKLHNSQYCWIKENRIINSSTNGITINSDDVVIINNRIQNSTEYGIYLSSGSDSNKIYLNRFYNNLKNNSYDLGTGNQWDNGSHGNYWDDYQGIDPNDDGKGNVAYDIPGGSSKDYYPLWWDAPEFLIQSPSNSTIYTTDAPTVTLFPGGGFVDTYWYTIEGDLAIYNFTGLTGTLNQTGWNKVQNGTIFIYFYANDSQNYITIMDLKLKKDVLGPFIFINDPDPNQEFGEVAPAAGNFSVIFQDGNGVEDMWYMLYNSSHHTDNKTWTGSIDQELWDEFSEGDITIRFFANDSLGNLNGTQITIKKLIDEGETNGKDDEKDNDDTSDTPPPDNILSFIVNPMGLGLIGGISGLLIVSIITLKKRRT